MIELPTKQFWMVYGIGCGEPTKMHSTKEIALGEAKRLARYHPDQVFVVLESIAAAVKRDVDVVTIKRQSHDENEQIPF